MNQTIESILTRRSVRRFTDQPIEEESLRQIVECGIYAPSARNRQNWHFTVICDTKMIDEVNRITLKGMDQRGIKIEPDEHVFYHAPVVIILSSVLEGFSEMNAGCAIENMAIAAKSLGINSCIIGQTRFMFSQNNKVDINRMLKIPMEFEHDCAICFGYRQGEAPVAKPRREGVVDYIR